MSDEIANTPTTASDPTSVEKPTTINTDNSPPTVSDESNELPVKKPTPAPTTTSKASSSQEGMVLLGVPLAWDKQKSIKELTLRDILLWRNLYVSLILFLSGQAAYILLTRYNYSVITLVGRVVLLQVIVFFLLNVATRVMKNSSKPVELPLGDFKLSQDLIQPVSQYLVDTLNCVLNGYVDILMCQNLGKTVVFGIAVHLLCWLANRISGVTLVYLVFTTAFALFKVYELKQAEIDKIYVIAEGKIKETWNKLMVAVPKAASTSEEKKTQ